MTIEYDYRRYLQAKRSVDDRALNRPVLEMLRSELNQRGAPRVLELGGGTGSMWHRSRSWSLFEAEHYTLVDLDGEALAELAADPRLRVVEAEIASYLRSCTESFDLVIANAVLDLVGLREVLPLLWNCCRPEALFWFTINFDGESTLLPELGDDAAILEAYHQSMNRRPGSRYSGRALFSELHQQGATVLAAGSSDWVVHPRDACYPEDEGYFAHHIVHTIDLELRDDPPVPVPAFRDWVSARHQHIEDGVLVYIAHQLDFLGRPPRSSS